MKGIMIGCPINDRAWILPEYLSRIYNLNYPKNKIHLAFFINGPKQTLTNNILREFHAKFENQYRKIDIWYMYHENTDNRARRNYNFYSQIRNYWLSMRDKEDDYIFSVDSDILLEPDTLNQLLGYNKDFVSALICNGELGPTKVYNIMNRFGDIFTHVSPRGGLQEIDLTGACSLMSKKLLDSSVSYNFHPQGEDGGFCKQAYEKGFKIYCDTDLELEHRMEKDL